MGNQRKAKQLPSKQAVDYSSESEAETRQRIDADLRSAGWDANSQRLAKPSSV
jgi:type I site-specific restriction endonuclease